MPDRTPTTPTSPIARRPVRTALLMAAALAGSWTMAHAHAQTTSPIVKLDPALDALLAPDATLEKLAGGFKEALEGGVWVRKGNYLLFSNKGERLINKWTAAEGVTIFLNLGADTKVEDPAVNLSSGTTLDREGRLVYCSQGERAIIRVEKDGRRTVLADAFEGTRFGSPNDLVYRSDGTLYFTDNPKGAPGGAFMLKDGKVSLITRELRRHNGIGLSPDEKILYVNDSGGGQRRCVWRFTVQPDGRATDGRMWVDMTVDATPPPRGIPDGMKVDSKGNVWDGGPGGLWILSPEGKHLGTVSTPDQISNMAFGDPDGKTLFLTLHTALYRLRTKVPGLIP
jgi:gluconolactonase